MSAEGNPPELTGILETVLYCSPENEPDVRRFYSETLGLTQIGKFSYRVGANMLLVFNVSETSVQDDPPPHGATGPVHTCFLTTTSQYDAWKKHLEGSGISVTREIEWPNGAMSFYFDDPAGNVLEIADSDLWRKS